MDDKGFLHLDSDEPMDPVADAELGPRPRMLNMQQLSDPDTAALLVPSYVRRLNGEITNADVLLKDMQQELQDLTALDTDMDWSTELHILCLAEGVHEEYKALWCR